NVPVSPDFSWTATARAPAEQMKPLAKGGKTFEGGKLIETKAEPSAPAPAEVAKAEPAPQTAAAAPTSEPSKSIRPDKPGPPGSNNRFNQIVDQLTNRVSDIVRNDKLTPPLVALALAIAALMGAVHAFTPGHGKT